MDSTDQFAFYTILIATVWIVFFMAVWIYSLPKKYRTPTPQSSKRRAARLCSQHAMSRLKPGEMAVLDAVNCDACHSLPLTHLKKP